MGFYDKMKKQLTPRSVDRAAIEAAEDLGLQDLAVFSGLSVKTLRSALTDPEHPLTHHRIGARVLVNKDAYRKWRAQFQVDQNSEVSELVERVVGPKALAAARERLKKGRSR
jgi:hypothetical protein